MIFSFGKIQQKTDFLILKTYNSIFKNLIEKNFKIHSSLFHFFYKNLIMIIKTKIKKQIQKYNN